MKINMGSADRVARLILGVLIIGAGVFYQSYWGAVGIIPLFTAGIKWCPIYVPFGLSTCKRSDKDGEQLAA